MQRFYYTTLLLALVAMPALGQTETIPRATRTVAIQNATIHVTPDNVLQNATVVFRDGLVHGVGVDLAIPFDAEVITGDSLHVYAGFIDGLSHTGFTKPKESSAERPKDPGNPPNDRAGIQPERLASRSFDPTNSTVDALRKAGFTTSHVVEHGRMLPGSGALVNLGTGTRAQQIVNPDAALVFQFTGASRMYPATPMAMTAKFRQLYRESRRRSSARTINSDSPTARIESDEVYTAFDDVVTSRKPVVAKANTALEIFRAAQLKKDLNFRLIIAGGKQAAIVDNSFWGNVDGLLLTLEMPKDLDKETKADSTEHNPRFVTGDQTGTKDEEKNLRARKREAHKMYSATAAKLANANIQFGFAILDTKPKDVQGNIRKMIDAGLSKRDALAALTSNGAEVLGASAILGTLEEGKIANAVVTSGSYFEKDRKIKYVLVDGIPHELPEKEEKDKKGNTGDDKSIAVGDWDFSFVTEDGPISGTLALTGSDDALRGTVTSNVTDEIDLESAELDGDELTVVIPTAQWGKLTVVAELDGDSFSGTIASNAVGPYDISGTRKPEDK